MMGSRLLKYEMEKRRLASGMSFVFGQTNYVENLVLFGQLRLSVHFGVDSEMLNAVLAKITVCHEDLMTPTKNGTKIQASSMLKYMVHLDKVRVYRTGTDIVLLLAVNENLETYRKLAKSLLC